VSHGLEPRVTALNHESRVTDNDRPPAILLMGPTASGKTGLAARLSARFPLEIVSVDSVQIYRQMDIGTAKPARATLEAAPHHLIDIVDPTARYSAAQFCEDANELLAEIRGRGNIPLLSGGTMLYFKALQEGLSPLPAADPDTRLVIDGMAEESGWPVLHAELARVDPVTAGRLQPTDAQRIQRALEVYYLTGQPMSALIARGRASGPALRMIPIALEPSDRSVLHERIAERFEIMLELGLIGEVRGLRERFDLNASLPSMRAVGYRQVWQYLDGEFGLKALREKGIAATRQLAKRQLTWLRSWEGAARFDCLAENLPEQVADYLTEQLQG
jgi:tRNA dimethylallyltransferase